MVLTLADTGCASADRKARKVLPALSSFMRNVDDEPPEPVEHEHIEEPAGQRPSHEIHFERFKKLHEFYVVEKAIEVYAPLRGEQGSRLLRLEALWSPQEHGYQVAVYRQIGVPVASMWCAAGQEGMGSHVVHLWVPYDLIRSVLPTAEKALEEVMGFVEMRCRQKGLADFRQTNTHVPLSGCPSSSVRRRNN